MLYSARMMALYNGYCVMGIMTPGLVPVPIPCYKMIKFFQSHSLTPSLVATM